MDNVEKFELNKKLRMMASSPYGLHNDANERINFTIWIENNEDYKSIDKQEVINMKTDIQKNINPKSENIQLLMYVNNQFVKVDENILIAFNEIYNIYEDLLNPNKMVIE